MRGREEQAVVVAVDCGCGVYVDLDWWGRGLGDVVFVVVGVVGGVCEVVFRGVVGAGGRGGVWRGWRLKGLVIKGGEESEEEAG